MSNSAGPASTNNTGATNKSSGAFHRHYTDEERQTLVQLVLQRIDVIERRQNDTMTLSLKQEAWRDIMARFNGDPCCYFQRDMRQIKKLWDNVKTRAKRLVADRRLQRSLKADELDPGDDVGESKLAEEFADLDTIADDSLAEKVIYFMSRPMVQRQSSRHHVLVIDDDDDVCDNDDDKDDDEQSVTYVDQDTEYSAFIQPHEDGHMASNENSNGLNVINNCITSSKRSAVTDSSYLPSKRMAPFPRHNLGQQHVENFDDSNGGQHGRQPGQTSSSSVLRTAAEAVVTHADMSNNVSKLEMITAGLAHKLGSQSHLFPSHRDLEPMHQGMSNSSGFQTSLLTTTVASTSRATDGDGWMTVSPHMSDHDDGQNGNQGSESQQRVPGSSTKHPNHHQQQQQKQQPQQQSQQQRSLKRLQKEECALRIRKLKLEMKFARLEHEEKMKVMRAQQDVLKTLKPNPSSIIGSLFK